MIVTKAKILRIFSALIIVTTVSNFLNCSATFEHPRNIRSPEYKIESVSDFKIAGISLSDKKSAKDFSTKEQAKLSEAISKGKLLSSFTLNIIARNPNDGTEGTKKFPVMLKKFNWKLLVNEKETDSGNVAGEIEIDTVKIIPLKISCNVLDYIPDYWKIGFSDSFISIVNDNFSISNMKVIALPDAETRYSELIKEEITIVNYEFR